MKDEKIAKEIAFLKKENLYRKIKTVTSIKRNKILVDGKENKQMIQQFLDLALLSQGLLKGEKLTDFIKRSVNLI